MWERDLPNTSVSFIHPTYKYGNNKHYILYSLYLYRHMIQVQRPQISLVPYIWDESAKKLHVTSNYVGWMEATLLGRSLYNNIKASITYRVLQIHPFARLCCNEWLAKTFKWGPWDPKFESCGHRPCPNHVGGYVP